MIEVLTIIADKLMLEMWRSTFARSELVATDNDVQVAKSWERGVLRQMHFRHGVVKPYSHCYNPRDQPLQQTLCLLHRIIYYKYLAVNFKVLIING